MQHEFTAIIEVAEEGVMSPFVRKFPEQTGREKPPKTPNGIWLKPLNSSWPTDWKTVCVAFRLRHAKKLSSFREAKHSEAS